MTIDVERVRAETPGCEERLHFNNAGASLMPRPVIDTAVAHLELEARIGGYEAKDAVKADLEHVYDAAARLINSAPNEIALLENAKRHAEPVVGLTEVLAGLTEQLKPADHYRVRFRVKAPSP